MFRILFCLSLFACISSGSLPASQVQEQDPQERFSTGPPSLPEDLKPSAPWGTSPPRPRAGAAAAPDGDDIKANPVSTSAQNETSFSVNPLDENNMVGVGNDYRNGAVETGWYTTQDGGQTWISGTLGIEPGFSFSGDPCVTFDVDGNCHIICMMYFGPGGSAVYHFFSTDGGATWSNGTEIDLHPENDKPQVGSDYSNGPTRGAVTTAWDRFGFPNANIHVSTLSGLGGSWSPDQRINDSSNTNTIAPDVAYGADSQLYVAWADRGNFNVWLDHSADGGATWGTDVIVAPYTQVPSPIPGSVFRMFDIFSIAADFTSGPNSGNVYVAYHTWNTGSNQNADVRCATSTDMGATWNDVLVNASDTTNADQVMPGIAVDTKGNVNMSFYDRRLDSNNFLLWTWVARSSNGGASFVNHPASDVGWNHQSTEFFGTFIGDYIDCDSYDGYVLPFWCDGRAGNSQEVYVDKVNLSLYGDVDQISAAVGGTVNLTINIGPNCAGQPYLVVGTRSGTSPGTVVGGLNVPVNQDSFTNFTIANANSANLQNTQGVLDATGSASATLDTLGPLNPTLIGTYHFAVVVNPAAPIYASRPMALEIVP